MKVLLCSACPLDPRLGAPKVVIEVAAAMEKLGATCRLAGVEEICPNLPAYTGFRRVVEFSASLATFVEKHARQFDVVDYDHVCLPFARTRFPARTLLVARSVILAYHFDKIRIRSFGTLRHRVGAVVKAPQRIMDRRRQIERALRTCKEADLLNVSNDHDRTELLARAFATEKIVVIPFGMTEALLDRFARSSDAAPLHPRIAFVGTFDERKGGPDLPHIVRHIVKTMPECKFRLLGTRRPTEGQVLSYFPSSLRKNIEVINSFEPESLPGLLHDCSLGIFPSHVEGFGFGVLEMLASSLPVIAYDAPGPPMMLPPDYLVPRGATTDLATTVLALLRDPDRLLRARTWARTRARDFTWTTAAEATIAAYSQHAAKLREGSVSA
jgi:glycosyltransferase involved in cell wall biosynthesis